MPSVGVNIAILLNDKILLTKREDFEVWCLPGGAVDTGESLAQAAIREAREETGLQVELTRLVGIYSQPRWHREGGHIAVIAARPTGGEIRPQPGEVLEIHYFGIDELPEVILFGQRRRILDALEGAVGLVVTQEAEWPLAMDMERSELYALRDQSGLSRRQFYVKVFGELGQDSRQERLEVGDACKNNDQGKGHRG